MKMTYTVSHESRRKAIAFNSYGNGKKITPVAYAQLFGYWLDLYNDRNGYRAEFGPYLTVEEADMTGDNIVAALNDKRLIAAAIESEQ